MSTWLKNDGEKEIELNDEEATIEAAVGLGWELKSLAEKKAEAERAEAEAEKVRLEEERKRIAAEEKAKAEQAAANDKQNSDAGDNKKAIDEMEIPELKALAKRKNISMAANIGLETARTKLKAAIEAK